MLTPPAIPAPARTAIARSRWRAMAALAMLVRRPLARRLGVRYAKIWTLVVGASLGAFAAYVLRTIGSDVRPAALVGHGAEMLTWVGAWITGFSLSATSPGAHEALGALAAPRGFDARALAWTRIFVCAWLGIETIVLGLLLFDFVFAVLAAPMRDASGLAAAMVVTGLMAAVVAAVLGVLAAVLPGRGLYTLVTLAPWVVAQLLPARTGTWVSLPGLLHEYVVRWVSSFGMWAGPGKELRW